jgi:hypothetical protein
MAIEITIFGIIAIAAILTYLSGIIFRTPFLFIFGCILLMGSGAALFGFNGIITGYYYDVNGVIQQLVTPISNVGLAMVALVLIVIPLLSLLVLNIGSEKKENRTFHY